MSAPTAICEVDAPEAAHRAGDGSVLLLDGREEDEWDAGHAPQAVPAPLGALEPASAPDDRRVVTVCRSGKRAGEAARLLTGARREVHSLTGGMQSCGGPACRCTPRRNARAGHLAPPVIHHHSL